MIDEINYKNAIKLSEIIAESKNICVFTGAGISVPSGIPDFRSAGGIFSETVPGGYSPEEVVSHKFFEENSELFYKFYKDKMIYPEAKPNTAHYYFASLEKEGREVTVVTQNIDCFHSDAGSTNVAQLHGCVRKNYCKICKRTYVLDQILSCDGVPACPHDGGVIRPDVVLYGEQLNPDVINRAIKYVSEADTLIIVGTSLRVYPAASFVSYFKGKTLALINKSATDYDTYADIVINADIIDFINVVNNANNGVEF